MPPTTRPRPARPAQPTRPDLGTALAAGLFERGFAVVDDVFGDAIARRLRADAERLSARGAFVPAGVGQGARRTMAPDVRRDAICWLDADAPPGARDGARGVRPPPSLRALLAVAEELRVSLNRALFLGLRRVECHLARYDTGAFYRPHVDSFAGDAARVVSFVYFLNPDWQADDGGTLRLHTDPILDVEPRLDRLAMFLSREITHEVTEVAAPRWTVTGWFSG